MPRFDANDLQVISNVLVPSGTKLDHDDSGFVTDPTTRLRQYLASTLLSHPDWWPWVLKRWGAWMLSRYKEWIDLVSRLQEAMDEGDHQLWNPPPVPKTFRHADISRFTAQIQQTLGSVAGGLKYSLQEVLELLDRLVSESSKLPELRTDFDIIPKSQLLKWHSQSLEGKTEDVVREFLHSPRRLWLALKMVSRPPRELETPYGDAPRDLLSVSPVGPPYDVGVSVVSDTHFPSQLPPGVFSYSVDGGPTTTVNVPGASRAELLAGKEPYVFKEDVQARLVSAAASSPVSLSTDLPFEVYIDGRRYVRTVPAGTYTGDQMVLQLLQALDTSGVPVSSVASISFDNGTNKYAIVQVAPGGVITIGDGVGGQSVNSYIGYNDWDTSDDDTNPGAIKGTLANNSVSLKMDKDPTVHTFSVPAGTYTAASLASYLSGLWYMAWVDIDSVGDRLRFRSWTYGALSQIEVASDQPVLGIYRGRVVHGSPATLSQLQKEIRDNHPDLLVFPKSPSPVYDGVMQRSGSNVVLASTDGIESGMVVYVVTGDKRGNTAIVTSVVDGTTIQVDTIPFDEAAVRGTVGDGRFILQVSRNHHQLSVSGSPYFSAVSETAVVDWVDVNSSDLGMKYIRAGDLISETGAEILEIDVDNKQIRVSIPVQANAGNMSWTVRSGDWDKLSRVEFPQSPIPATLNKLAAYINLYKSRPSGDLRGAVSAILTQYYEWGQQVIAVFESTLGQIRDLKDLEPVIDRLSQNGLDFAAMVFDHDPWGISSLFPVEDAQQENSWKSSERFSALARKVVSPPSDFDADISTSTVSPEVEGGDGELNQGTYVETEWVDGDWEKL